MKVQAKLTAAPNALFPQVTRTNLWSGQQNIRLPQADQRQPLPLAASQPPCTLRLRLTVTLPDHERDRDAAAGPDRSRRAAHYARHHLPASHRFQGTRLGVELAVVAPTGIGPSPKPAADLRRTRC